MSTGYTMESEKHFVNGLDESEIYRINNERVVILIANAEKALSTTQISAILQLNRGQVGKILEGLEYMGFLNVEPVSPGLKIVSPRRRLLDLDHKERNTLCRRLSTMEF